LNTYHKEFTKIKKINIKNTFGFYNELKDGSQGKLLQLPEIEEMHTSPKFIKDWVEYSTFDAEITYFLRETLSLLLSELPTFEEGLTNNYELYIKYWLPFGELLTDMEREGFKINTEYLKVRQWLSLIEN